MSRHKVYDMDFAKVYPLLCAKVEKKGRKKEEVDEVILWLTGYTQEQLNDLLLKGCTYENFFASAPQLHPNRTLITGVICGKRIEEIEDPLMREVRYLDKLVDEIAKGKSLDKVKR